MNSFTPSVKAEMKSLTIVLNNAVDSYFHDLDNRKSFEIWYETRYGKPYEWRTE